MSQRLISPEALAASAIIVLALALRLYRLTAQSLWYDEGVSAYMIPRALAEIAVATSVDIHPPLYYWLLSLWAVPFGQGEAALRGFSVLAGTLTVWATWRLGRLLGGTAVGLAAAAVLAVSPLAIQYSQEVRMYALAGLLAVCNTWAGLLLLRALTSPPRGGRRQWLLGVLYALLLAALIYTHYYGMLVAAAQQVYAALMLLPFRRWRAIAGWGLAAGFAGVLYLPWLPLALRQTGYYPGLGDPHPAWALLLDMVNVLSIGIATTRFGFRAGLVPFLVLAGIGLTWLMWAWVPHPQPLPRSVSTQGVRSEARGRGESWPLASPSPARRASDQMRPGKAGEGVRGWGPPTAAVLLLLWLLLPIGGILVLSQSRPLYEPRFLLLVLPAWCMLLGAGLVAVGRAALALPSMRLGVPPAAIRLLLAALAVIVTALLLTPIARSLNAYYFDPAYARDDYRGLAQTIAVREQPGDAVVLTAPGQIEIFSYYYRGQSDLFPLPLQRPIDPADTLRRLEALPARHERIWLVRWAANEADPNDLILTWLEAHGRRVTGQTFGRVELRLYDLSASARDPAPRQSVTSAVTSQPGRASSRE